jgi:hypothetical protein
LYIKRQARRQIVEGEPALNGGEPLPLPGRQAFRNAEQHGSDDCIGNIRSRMTGTAQDKPLSSNRFIRNQVNRTTEIFLAENVPKRFPKVKMKTSA